MALTTIRGCRPESATHANSGGIAPRRHTAPIRPAHLRNQRLEGCITMHSLGMLCRRTLRANAPGELGNQPAESSDRRAAVSVGGSREGLSTPTTPVAAAHERFMAPAEVFRTPHGAFRTPRQHRRTDLGSLPTPSPTSSDPPGKPSYPSATIVGPPWEAFLPFANIVGPTWEVFLPPRQHRRTALGSLPTPSLTSASGPRKPS